MNPLALRKPVGLTLFSLILILTGACQPDKGKGSVEIHKVDGHSVLCVDLDKALDTIDFDISELFDSCRLIRFENRKEASIGRI